MTPEQAAQVLAHVRANSDEVGLCLLWRLSVRNSGKGQPQANIGPWRGMALPRVVFTAQHGHPPREGFYVVAACGQRRCLACLQEATRSRAQKLAGKRGSYSHPVAVANRTAAVRSRSRFSDADVALVRDTSLSHGELHKRLGISRTYAQNLRAGVYRRGDLGVWQGLVR